MDRAELLLRARTKGVNPLVYWLVRAVLQPFFHVWFRMSRIGREHIPAEGPVIFAANHRSFLDPFVIATLARRPIYFVAKRELFTRRPVAWILNSLGAFPIDRGAGDVDAMATARAILERGDGVLIFPEGTRIRPGGLGRPRRGVGRLALETGAPVVPVAVIGTEDVRRGWRIRPRKVRIRAGRAAALPARGRPVAAARGHGHRPDLALRRPAVGVARRPPAAAPRRRGRRRQLGDRAVRRAGAGGPRGRARDPHGRAGDAPRGDARRTSATCPASRCPTRCASRARPTSTSPTPTSSRWPSRPATSPPPSRRSATGSRRRPPSSSSRRASCPPSASCPAPTSGARVRSRALAVLGGPAHAADALDHGAALVAASTDADLRAQLRELLSGAGFAVETTTDVAGVELAAAAKNAAVLAAATAAVVGPNAAGAAAGRSSPRSTPTPAATAGGPRRSPGWPAPATSSPRSSPTRSRNRRAGELLAQRRPGRAIGPMLGQAAEALDALPLLARALAADGVRAPAVAGLADVVEGARRREALGRAGHRRRLAPPGPRRLTRIGSVRGQGPRSTASSPSSTGRTCGTSTPTLLPGGQPPRRRGPDGADVPAGLPALRARAGASPTAGRCGPGSSASPTTWPRTSTATARASRRRRSRTTTTPLSTLHTTEDLVEGREELARILEGVKELPDDRREALIMRFALGMDNREIARAMGRTDGATKVLLHRAIKQLEQIVATRQGGG